MTNYELLRKRINELIPERLELKFGTELSGFSEALGRTFYLGEGIEKDGSKWIAVYPERWEQFCDRPKYSVCAHTGTNLTEYTILGQEVSIADVLRTLKKNGFLGGIECTGDIFTSDGKTICKINLSVPLSDPLNDEACGEIYKLLS